MWTVSQVLLCAGSTDKAAAERDENLDSNNRPADVQLQSPFRQAEPKAKWPIPADTVVKTEPLSKLASLTSDKNNTKKPKRKRGQKAAA